MNWTVDRVLGLSALVGAVAVLVLPGLGTQVAAALSALSPSVVVALLAAVAVAVTLLRASGSSARAPVQRRVRPDRDAPDRAPVLGASVTESLARATDADATRARRTDGRDRVRAALRDAAVDAVAVSEGVDRDAARETVLTGEWTDDPRAAAVVGDERAPSPPLATWLWDLVRGEDAFRRRVRHAVDAVREVDG